MTTLTSHERAYQRAVRSAVYALWRGVFDVLTFIDDMVNIIAHHITRAWNEGAAQCGIKPDELTDAEIIARDQFIANQYFYLFSFANDIDQGSRANRGKLTPLYQRTEMWIARYTEARSQAMQMACADQKLEWVWSPLKEHCVDCERLNGRVYRASIWQKHNIHPRMSTLACRGYKCGCSFAVTDKPITRGRPPSV